MLQPVLYTLTKLTAPSTCSLRLYDSMQEKVHARHAGAYLLTVSNTMFVMCDVCVCTGYSTTCTGAGTPSTLPSASQTLASCFNGATPGSTGIRRCLTYRKTVANPITCPAQFIDFAFAFYGHNGNDPLHATRLHRHTALQALVCSHPAYCCAAGVLLPPSTQSTASDRWLQSLTNSLLSCCGRGMAHRLCVMHLEDLEPLNVGHSTFSTSLAYCRLPSFCFLSLFQSEATAVRLADRTN
jgi:hypothetical protein